MDLKIIIDLIYSPEFHISILLINTQGLKASKLPFNRELFYNTFVLIIGYRFWGPVLLLLTKTIKNDFC